MLCTPTAGSMGSVQWREELCSLGGAGGGSAPRTWTQLPGRVQGALMAKLEAEHKEWHCLPIVVEWRAYIVRLNLSAVLSSSA